MLHDRHALITGAGTGIGAAIALQLAQAGCRLTLCGRSQDKLQAQAEALRAQVPDVAVLIVPMDVTDEHAVQAAMQQAQARFGPVNILVNNAGQAHSAPIVKTDAALWQQMLLFMRWASNRVTASSLLWMASVGPQYPMMAQQESY